MDGGGLSQAGTLWKTCDLRVDFDVGVVVLFGDIEGIVGGSFLCDHHFFGAINNEVSALVVGAFSHFHEDIAGLVAEWAEFGVEHDGELEEWVGAGEYIGEFIGFSV